MPTLTLKLAPPQPQARCEALASALTRLGTEVLGNSSANWARACRSSRRAT